MKISGSADFWTEDFTNQIKPSVWYNPNSTNNSPYEIRDFSSILLGPIVMKQKRVEESECPVKRSWIEIKNRFDDYMMFNEENDDFGTNWASSFIKGNESR